MFGEKIDYLILKTLAHSDNLATDSDLRQRELNHRLNLEKAVMELKKHLRRFRHRFPLDKKNSCLDIGCGFGDVDYALSAMGMGEVMGIDVVESKINTAKAQASCFEYENKPQFIAADVRSWESDKKFDLILSLNAVEHIAEPEKLFQRLPRLLNKEGKIFLGFCPLFYSPFGDHQWQCYKIQIPWRGLIFNRNALFRVRREFYRPDDQGETFEDVWLNRMKFTDFLKYTEKYKLKIEMLTINPQLQRILPLKVMSDILTTIPRLRDYLAASVYAVLSFDYR